jgi:sec-independent protein translocase protein TatB
MSFADTVVLFVLALLLFGPKKLPGIARQIGKALNEFKRASNEFKSQIESEIDQLEYQERQKKQQEEQSQKILPPDPPAGTVESSRFATLQGTVHEDARDAHEVNSTTPNTTNV